MKAGLKKKAVAVKTKFRPKIRSRHGSHDGIRGVLPRNDFPSVIRLGSLTPTAKIFPGLRNVVEINTVDAVKISMNKYLMKKKFFEAGVKTPDWWTYKNNSFLRCDNAKDVTSLDNLVYPIVAKNVYGSRGRGNYLLKDAKELKRWMDGKDLKNYIFEKFYSFTREYRLHINENGCFYTCRKVLIGNTPQDKRWYRNDSNCKWIRDDNVMFNRPVNWKDIEQDCIKALKAVGLDFAAFDVKVQSDKDEKGRKRPAPEWIVIESNSAPSFGEITEEKYLEMLPQLIKQKRNK